MSLTFVVSTGRCGSTMLSRVLKEHPDVLSLNEFLNTIPETRRTAGGANERFWSRDIDGAELWESLSCPNRILTALINAGIPVPEFIYPSAGRFGAADGVPRICNHVLSLLSSDPDSLYDRLAAEVPGWPARSVADQCRALFAKLGDMTGRRVTVERSGSSVLILPILRQEFPEARFILLHRDGPDCALSMSRHAPFRLEALHALAMQACPGLPRTASPADLSAAAPGEFGGLLFPPFDKSRFMSYRIPLSIFAGTWSHLTQAGVSALLQMPRDTWTSLGYENLVRSPRAPLTRLAGFIGVPALPQWLDWACEFINPGSVGSAQAHLDPDELASARAACETGSRLLSAIGPGLSA